MTQDYSDIIHLEHHQSTRHPHMSAHERAGQFAPFAALSTHASTLRETARLTLDMVSLDKDQKEILQRRLLLLGWKLQEHPIVRIRYFVPDKRKQGGAYRELTGRVRDIRQVERVLLLEDHQEIPLDAITEINGGFLEEVSGE